MSFRMLVPLSAIAIVLFLWAAAPVHGQTTFNGGNVFSAASWSNGLPSVGNPGTIATNGTFSGIYDFNQNVAGTATITISGGTLTANGPNFYNGPINTAAGWTNFDWQQTGGTINLNSGLSPNLRNRYTLSGGTITGSGSITSYHTGTFHQSGGTVSGNIAYVFNDTSTAIKNHTFTGGEGTGGIPGFQIGSLNTAVIDGTFRLTFNSSISTNSIGTSGTGIINFQDTWTGSWTRDNFTAADWQAIFTRTGMQYEGTQITTANFATTFSIYNPGLPGSTISIVPVPEPVCIMGVFLLAAGAGVTVRRFKKAKNDRLVNRTTQADLTSC